MTVPILLTPTEAARALGIGRSKLYELMQAGVVESVRIGSCRRIPADALFDLVARLRVDAGPWPPAARPRREAGPGRAAAI
jgi:excisionase family DNA binding protein